MTREEASFILANIDRRVCDDELNDALDMAIKALEQNESAEEWYKLFVEKLDQEPKAEPCEDCISRQAVLDLMRSLTRWCVRSEDGKFNNVGLLYDDVMFGIDRLPSVQLKTEQEPKTGHWIVHPKGIYAHLVCDNCLSRAPYDCKTNYCPTCGRRMVEPQESEG